MEHKVIKTEKEYQSSVKPLLENMGAIEEEEAFEKRIKSGELFTVEEAKAESKRRIRLWWGK